jgi:ABC-type multidrug transport system ATPase subunit
MTRLRVVDVHKSFRDRPVLAGVGFDLAPGQLTGIVGESGAGKSTLLRILAGEIHADRGHAATDGMLGYCPQRIVMDDDLTVEQHLRFFKRAYRIASLDRADRLSGILGLDTHLHTCVGLLGRTARQKLNVVLSLMHEPDVVLFDEPYQGFDHRNRGLFWEIVEELRGRGSAVVLAGHVAHEPGRFDQLFSLRGGRLHEPV